LCESKGNSYNENDLKQFVVERFNEVDLDGNGKIDFDEFKVAIKNNKLYNNLKL
jgi:Ca2+-binding EF-hand superfamily protein